MSANTILSRWSELRYLLTGICKIYKHSKHIQNSTEERAFTPLCIPIASQDCNAILDILRELAVDGGRLRPELQIDVDGIIDGLNQVKYEYCQICSSNPSDEVIVRFLEEFRCFISYELVSSLKAMNTFDSSSAKDWKKVFYEPFAQEGEHLIHTLLYTGKEYGQLELEDVNEILLIAGRSVDPNNKPKLSAVRSPKSNSDSSKTD